MTYILRTSGGDPHEMEIIRGEGCYVYDADGARYVDFEAGIWAASLGHNHPRVTGTIRTQAEAVMHLGFRYTHSVVEDAAQEVVKTVGLANGRCIFLNSGSEAVEFGVQAIRRITEKPLLLTFAGSYLAAFGSAGQRRPDEWVNFDWSGCGACPHQAECDADCPNLKAVPFEDIGGLVFEPGNAGGRVKLPPAALIRTIESLVRQNGGIVMANEITTGIGRTGEWFGFEHDGLKPDIVAIGKGLGSGYPVSAVVMESEVADRLLLSGFRYAQSHQNDALGCAVAREVVTVIREENLIERSRRMGALFRDRLIDLSRKHSEIREVRSRGLMIAVEFREDDEGFSLAEVHRSLLAGGFLTGFTQAANLLRFYPPLIIEEDDISALMDRLDDALGRRAMRASRRLCFVSADDL